MPKASLNTNNVAETEIIIKHV